MKDERTYDVLIDVWNKPEPYFKFTLPKFARGFLGKHRPWRVAPDDKKQPVHVLGGTRQALVAVFPNAIVFGSPAGKGKGRAGGMSLMFMPIPVMFFYIGIQATILGATTIIPIMSMSAGIFFLLLRYGF